MQSKIEQDIKECLFANYDNLVGIKVDKTSLKSMTAKQIIQVGGEVLLESKNSSESLLRIFKININELIKELGSKQIAQSQRVQVDNKLAEIFYMFVYSREAILNFYESQKQTFKYDPINFLQNNANAFFKKNGGISLKAEQQSFVEGCLRALNIFLNTDMNAFSELWETSLLYLNFKGFIQQYSEVNIRALYLNLIMKLNKKTEMVNERDFLKSCYSLMEEKNNGESKKDGEQEEYLMNLNLIADSEVVSKIFAQLNFKITQQLETLMVQNGNGENKVQKKSSQINNEEDDDDEDDEDSFLVQKKTKTEGKGKSENQKNNNKEESDIILTEVEIEELKELEKLILSENFIVLNGPLSSGKSAYVEYLRKFYKNQILTLFVDYTTDLKSLLGSYVCTEKIGQFEWKDGPLVKAMEEGKWLVFKNFQEANEEILNGLDRIAQSNEFFLQSQGRTIQAHFRFKIIGIGSFGREHEAKKATLKSYAAVFEKIPMNLDHLKKILKQKFPLMFRHEENLVFERIEKALYILQQNNNNSNLSSRKGGNSSNNKKLLNLNVNKILALFQRINFHIEQIYGKDDGISNRILTEEFRKTIYMEFCDVLVLHDKNNMKNEVLHEKLLSQEVFNLGREEYEMCILKYNPEIELSVKKVKIGKLGTFDRDLFMKNEDIGQKHQEFQPGNTIIYNAYSSRLLEKITSCIYFNEPCLLVGDTGCGKTTMAQHCAEIFKKTLHIYNMSQGSDAIDLIGGFKPIDVRVLLKKLLIKYVKCFGKVANIVANKQYIDNLKQLFQNKQFVVLMKCILDSFKGIQNKIEQKYSNNNSNNNNNEEELQEKNKLVEKFKKIQKKVENIYINRDKIESNLAFSFIEGNLIKAIKHGDWILIDEINLANNEVLQKLLPIIEGKSLVLYERGDLREIKRHPDFRILTCMNPGSDIGKKELPANIKAKFTEIFVHDIEQYNDMLHFVQNKVKNIQQQQQQQQSGSLAEKIVALFQDIKKACLENLLEDGYNKRQHVSLRNLSRALNYVRQNLKIYGLERCLYDGLYLGFGTALSRSSQLHFEGQVEKIIGVSSTYYNNNLLKQKLKIPEDCVEMFGFYVKKGELFNKVKSEEFLVTNTFRKYIIDLLRAIAHTDLPVLLEGPTSSGKTSIVKYIASLAGYKCVRVNNHQHTDVEEYIGTYLPDNKGRLVFQEGVLIEAMKKGHWLILDELNLARSEILESLNRLLDDNKEIFINETQTYVKPHPNFRLFATQNPTTYGGRKELSKAFKNRFIQLYFDEICDEDLELILQKRCVIAPSYCKRLMNILKDLKIFRQRSNFFGGKEGVVTVRDLIKWGQREVENLEQLGLEGYCLLAERLRSEEERAFIQKTIEKHLKVKLDVHSYYTQYTMQYLDPFLQDFPYYLQVNHSFRRMAALALKSIRQNEPVLLIGETGCGKTTISQLIAHIRKTQMFSINCHQYTESSDFLGSLRPVRQKENLELKAFLCYLAMDSSEVQQKQSLYTTLTDQTLSIEKRVETLKEENNVKLLEEFLATTTGEKSNLDGESGQQQLVQSTEQLLGKMEEQLIHSETLFEWQDGPLVQSMQQGAVFLIDEISLAEDSVLERLNSVLEPTRSLLLPEKGNSQNLEEITAQDSFLIIATMNPGGDFGKKELSPALRNRFTEIWVEPITAKMYLEIQSDLASNDVYCMINDYLTVKKVFAQEQGENKLNSNNDNEARQGIAKALFEFLRFFNLDFVAKYSLEKRALTMRDILAIMEFIVKCRQNNSSNNIYDSKPMTLRDLYYHAIDLAVVESVGFLMISQQEKSVIRKEIQQFLNSQCVVLEKFDAIQEKQQLQQQSQVESETLYGLPPFLIQKGNYYDAGREQMEMELEAEASHVYSLKPQKVQENLMKVMRALQLDKSILLEGMPGVGKSSLVEYIAHKANKKLVKISLSEQTDIVDLLGSDLPSSNGDKKSKNQGMMSFKWYDGVLLDALKTGKWILLDELNLASQTILEGLNAILDHRGTVFIPEMNESFTKHPDFRIFACQNPVQIGGGRKGLPSSFLNRFTKIHFEDLSGEDLQLIMQEVFATSGGCCSQDEIFQKAIVFSQTEKGNSGNLRDLLRFGQIYNNDTKRLKMALEIAFVEGERQPFRRRELLELIKSAKYFKEEYENCQELKLRKAIPHNFNYSHQLKNEHFKTMFVPHVISETLKNVYEILPSQRAFMISGSKGVGKSEFVRFLREVVVRNQENDIHIEEVSLNSQVDSTELIGAYDQVDLKRQFSILIEKVQDLFKGVVAETLKDKQNLQLETVFLILQMQNMLEKQAQVLYLAEDVIENKSSQVEKKLLQLVQQLLQKLQQHLQNGNFEQKKSEIEQIWNELSANFEQNQQQQQQFKGNFDWFFSNIIRAVQRGDWLVLDNVQNANQAVLARLNPLFERPLFQKSPKLVITECHQQGSDKSNEEKNEIMEIEVHPDFKLFLLWDSSCAQENISLNNKCTQINLDRFTAGLSQNQYESDLLQMASYAFTSGESKLEIAVVEAVQKIRKQLPPSVPCEFRSFEMLLQNLRNGAFCFDGDYFEVLIKKSLKNAYSTCLHTFSIDIDAINKLSNNKVQMVKEEEGEKSYFEQLKSSVDAFQRNAEQSYLQFTEYSKSPIVLHFSNFTLPNEVFTNYKLKLLNKLLSENVKVQNLIALVDSQKSDNSNQQQQYQSSQLLQDELNLIRQLEKHIIKKDDANNNGNDDFLQEIASKEYGSRIALSVFAEKARLFSQQINVLQRLNEFRNSCGLIGKFFESIFSKLKQISQLSTLNSTPPNQPQRLTKLIKKLHEEVALILDFLTQQIASVPKYAGLVIPHTIQVLKKKVEEEEEEKGKQQGLQFISQMLEDVLQEHKQIAVLSQKMVLKMELWKCCEYYRELPKTQEQDFLRKLVKFLLSNDISNDLLYLEKQYENHAKNKKKFNNNSNNHNNNHFLDCFDLQNLLQIRTQFRNMYFIDSKTRQISMEFFAFLSKQAQQVEGAGDQTKRLFEAFLKEIERILEANPMLKDEKELEKRYVIQIEDEYQNEVLKQIPIYADATAIQYFTLSSFRKSCFSGEGNQQQLYNEVALNLQHFDDFVSFFVFSNVCMLTLLKAHSLHGGAESQSQSWFSRCLKETLQVVDAPDVNMVKVVQFLKTNDSTSLMELVEVFILARIKNSWYSECQVKEMANNVLSVHLKQIPFLNNQIGKVRTVLDTHYKLLTHMASCEEEEEKHSNEEKQMDKNYFFFDSNKTQMAELWLLHIFQRIFKNNTAAPTSSLNEWLQTQFLENETQQQQQQSKQQVLLHLFSENLIAITEAIREQRVGQIGYEILKLFGFEELMQENLGVILKEEMDFGMEAARHCHLHSALAASTFVGKNNNDDSFPFFEQDSHRVNKKMKKMDAVKKLAVLLQGKIVFRGGFNSGACNTTEELEYFFQQNQIFIQRIVELNISEHVHFEIFDFYRALGEQKQLTNAEFKQKMEEKQREFLLFVQQIDNFLQVSHSNFYQNFSDFLIPYYFGLLLVKDHVLAGVRNIQQHLVSKRYRKMRYQLLNKSYSEKVDNLLNYVSADLDRVDVVLDEIFDAQNYETANLNLQQNQRNQQQQQQQQQQHSLLYKQVMDYCEENLLKKEEIDKLKEDDAKRFIIFQKKIQKLIVDEYTQEAVDAQKREELEAIQQQFNTYQNDFANFLETAGDMKERLEKQKEDLEYQERMKQLDERSQTKLKTNIFTAVLKILKKDAAIVSNSNYGGDIVLVSKKQRSKKLLSLRNVQAQSFQENFANLGLKFAQNQVVNSDVLVHDLLSLCEFSVALSSYTAKHKFDELIERIQKQQQQKQEQEVEANANTTTTVKYNVYKDAVAEETALIYRPLNILLLKVNELLNRDEFYNNQILQNIAILIDYLLESNFSGLKLSKLITGLQYIAEKCNEWDIAVPRAFGLKAETEEIVDLILKWRRKEKSGWKVLLEDKEVEIQEMDIIMFLKLRQLLVEYVAENKDEKELYSLCYQFISTATVGTMEMRLQMLHYIANYDFPHATHPRERKILNSISQYFAFLFKQELLSKVEAEKKQFEQDIDEYRKLAGWDSKNYVILKATVEKFHKRVFRICKKYKDFMQEPARVHVFEPYRKKLLLDNYLAFYEHFLQKQFQRKYLLFGDKTLDQVELQNAKIRKAQQLKKQQKKNKQKNKDTIDVVVGESENIDEEQKPEDYEYDDEIIDIDTNIFENFYILDFQSVLQSEQQLVLRGMQVLNKNQLVLCKRAEKIKTKTIKGKSKSPLRQVAIPVTNEKQQQISSYVYVEEMIADVFDRVNSLKDDATSTKLMKLRAVQDLFKHLKSIGFTSFYKSSLYKDKTAIYEFENIDQHTIAYGFSEEEDDDDESNNNDNQQYLRECVSETEKNYYQMLDRISTYKTNSSFARDLSSDYVKKAGGFMIEYFYFLKDLYINQSQFLTAYTAFKKLCQQLHFLKLKNNNQKAQESPIVTNVNPEEWLANLKDIMFCVQQIAAIFEPAKNEFLTLLLDLTEVFDSLELHQFKQALTSDFVTEFISKLQTVQQKAMQIVQGVKKTLKIEQYILVKEQVREGVVSVLEKIIHSLQTKLENVVLLPQQDSSESPGQLTTDVQLLVQNSVKCVQNYKKTLWTNIQKQQQEETENQQDDPDDAENIMDIEQENNENKNTKKKQEDALNIKKNEQNFMKKLTFVIETFNKKIQDKIMPTDSNKDQQQQQLLTLLEDENGLQLLQLFEKYLQNLQIYGIKSLESFSKFGNILSGIFLNLFYRGFCHPAKDGEDGEGSGEGDGKTDFKDGTGIGEGKGVQNVTDQMQFEEQMLGMKDEEENSDNEIEEDLKEDQEKKQNDFDMDQDFKGKNDDLSKEEKEKEQEKAEQEGNDEFDDVDEEQVDPKMWEGDEDQTDNEDQQDDENNEQKRRQFEDLEFKQKNKNKQDEEDEQLQAKEKQKDKDKQRNIEDFEKEEDKKNQNNNDEDQAPDLNQEEINELNKDDADYDDKDFENLKEGEKLDEDKAKAEELDLNDDDQLPEEPGDENLQEFSQEGGSEEEELGDDFDNEMLGDPLDKPEEANNNQLDNEEDEEMEQYPDQIERQNEQEDDPNVEKDGEMEQEDEEEEDKKGLDEKKRNYEREKKIKDQRFGVQNSDQQANDDVMQEEQVDADNEEQEKHGENGEEGGENIENDDENDNQNPNKDGFSQDFLKEITKTLEAFNKSNFVRDLKVVEENQETLDNNENQQNDMDKINEKDQEFEAVQFEDMEEMENAVATNMRKDMKNNNEEKAKKSDLPEDEENTNNNNKKQQKQDQESNNNEQKKEEQEDDFRKENQKQKLDQNKKKDKPNEEDKMEEEENEEDKIDYKKEIDKKKDKQQQEKDQEQGDTLVPRDQFQKNQKMELENDDEEEDETQMQLEKVDHNMCKLKVQELVKHFRENKEEQERGIELWQKMEQETRYYCMQLAEELKVILEPQQIQNFKGDYKSGKRLNMKKIINYIASNFRKNKIWLRRSAPSKRTYQILIGIDDSYSMQEQNVGYLALQSLTTVSLAMSKMEVGDMAIAAIHKEFKLIHPLQTPLTPADVPFILSQFTFDYQDQYSADLSLANFMRGAIDMYTEVKQRDSQQICFIISDGRFNKKIVKPLISEGEENNIMFVFIILDSKKDEKQSIMNLKSTDHCYVDGKLKIKMNHYLIDFPFKYYIVVQDMSELSKVLVDILRQYFEIENK